MASIWVKDFNGGLDTRRLPETTSGGVLLRARNGHINRGGEFEQRAAFVPEYELPDGTVGMFHDTAGLVVFGSGPAPALPAGITYQRLRHPNGSTALARVASADLYRGKVYAAAEFADGSIQHYYDGERVTDWYDGRASASFTVTGGSGGGEIANIEVAGVAIIGAAVPWNSNSETTAQDIADAINAFVSPPDYTAVVNGATVIVFAAESGAAPNGRVMVVTPTSISVTPVSATFEGGYTTERAPGTFTVTGGGVGGGSQATGAFDVIVRGSGTTGVAAIRVNNVNIMGATASANTNNSMAVAIAASINAHTSTPNYTATVSGSRVTVKTATPTAAVNGKTFVLTPWAEPGFARPELSSVSVMSGGADAYTSRMTGMQIGGVSVINAPVTWATSNAATAAAVAAAINSFTSSPDYTATVAGAVVSIQATVPGTAPDGAAVTFTLTDGFAVTPTTFTLADTPAVYQPGTFVKTIGQKMYATSGSVMHFSGIREPTKWTTDTVGAGFVDMSEENSGSEDLTALARYQNFVAVFAERAVQIWYVDPDPDLNRQTQVLNNTGTASPKSVTAFGDTDIFYLDESGLRSLRARDSSNAAATTDIGIPVDSLVLEQLATFDTEERNDIAGLIEPVNGRFWLVMKDKAFVFSYFPGSKISAWSEYTMEYTDEGGNQQPFEVTDALAFRRRVYLRSGNQIFVYSGLDGETHDATPAEAWLPYLDGNEPAKPKQFSGIDAALRGLWEVSAAMYTADEAAQDKVGIISTTTYDLNGRVPLHNTATHISLRFKSQGVGPHKLAACAIHFEGKDKAQ